MAKVALSERVIKKATIRRAASKSRSELRELLTSQIDALQVAYSRALNDISLSLYESADGQGVIRIEQLNQLKQAITQRLELLNAVQN